MKNNITKQNEAFTLIELLVVIAIIATIIGLALPNFLGARARARDARRKSEMNELKTALQLYYNDFKLYPGDSGGPLYNVIKGCGTNGITACPCSTNPQIDFASGGTGCQSVYMIKFPDDFAGGSLWYYQVNGGVDFCLKDTLENSSDSDIEASHVRCANKCQSSNLGSSDYAVCSE